MHTFIAQLKKVQAPAIAFVIIIALWELVDIVFQIKEVIIPNPHEILFAFIDNFESIVSNTAVTLIEALVGFGLGAIAGISIAIVFELFPILKKALLPYAIAFKATPVYVLAPLFILWFGNNMMPKMAVAMIVTTFPVLVNTVKGLGATSTAQQELFQSMGASPWQRFVHLNIPTALSHIFPALKIATTLSLIGATIAEFTGSQKGIGHLIVISSYYIDTSLMFAAIISISIIGVLFFFTVQAVEKKVVFWQN